MSSFLLRRNLWQIEKILEVEHLNQVRFIEKMVVMFIRTLIHWDSENTFMLMTLYLLGKEQELLKAQLDGLDVYTAGNASINFVFDRYISLKQHLKDSTRSGYIYTYNHFVRKDFGKKKIADIKYSDVVQYYLYLLKDKNIALGTLDSIHCLLHPTFELAVRDDIIRKNPATRGK